MKKIAFILICALFIFGTLYMGFTCWSSIEKGDDQWIIAIRAIGTIAWALMSYRIVTKKDRWMQKTFK